MMLDPKEGAGIASVMGAPSAAAEGGGGEGRGSDYTVTQMWVQDPSTGHGVRKALIAFPVADGPRDDLIQVEGPVVRRDADGNMLVERNPDPNARSPKFDAVHAYTVVRQTIAMWEQSINQFNLSKNPEAALFRFRWAFEGPITIRPYAFADANAYYSRMGKELSFGVDSTGSRTLFLIRSTDVLAHEAGHGILDGIRPEYFRKQGGYRTIEQTAAFHEAFGDITAILLMLYKPDILQSVVVNTKGEIDKDSFLPRVAEEFGMLALRRNALRNADNDVKYSDIPIETRGRYRHMREPHALSEVFTGAFFRILNKAFELYQDPRVEAVSDSLSRAAKHVAGLLLYGIVHSPKVVNFASFGRVMYEAEDNAELKAFIQAEFARRDVDIMAVNADGSLAMAGVDTAAAYGITVPESEAAAEAPDAPDAPDADTFIEAACAAFSGCDGSMEKMADVMRAEAAAEEAETVEPE